MNGHNGANGSDPADLSEWPGEGLWLLIIDGGVGYLAQTTEEMSESDVAREMALTGHAKLTLRPIYVLDSLRTAMADENRNIQPGLCVPIFHRIDQRIGLSGDFPVSMTARSVAYLSTMEPAVRAQLRGIIDRAEAAILKSRAKAAGISLAGH
jgi:hypothetical protein